MTEDTGLRGLLAKATPGPWVVHRSENDPDPDVRPADLRSIVAFGEGCYLPEMEAANLSLIALCPDAVALLCDMAEALMAVRDWIREAKGSEADAAEKMDAALARFAELKERAS